MNKELVLGFLKKTLENASDYSKACDDNIQPSARYVQYNGAVLGANVKMLIELIEAGNLD